MLRNYLIARWGKLPVRDVKPLTVEAWLKSLKDRKKAAAEPDDSSAADLSQ